MKKIKRKIGNIAREILVHAEIIKSRKSQKKIVMFPWQSERGSSSSRERVYRMAIHLKALGWRVIVVPYQLSLKQRQRLLKIEKPDILFLQTIRHPLNSPELYQANHIVFDIDDADFENPAALESVIDCCTGSSMVICGSTYIRDFCLQYNDRVHVVWTGMENQHAQYSPPSTRSNIVAWGTSNSHAYAAERAFVGKVAKILSKRIEFELWIYGATNHSDLLKFQEEMEHIGVRCKLIAPMSFTEYHKSLESCAVGLHPISLENPFSRGKSFGKLNSYMQRGVPIVTQHALDYPEFFIDGKSAVLADGEEEWADRIEELLRQPALRDSLASNAFSAFLQELDTHTVAKKIGALLEKELLQNNIYK
jgi:hypothetical protein